MRSFTLEFLRLALRLFISFINLETHKIANTLNHF